MKESKAVYVTRHKIRDDQNIVYQLNANWDREYIRTNRYDNYNKNNDFACQFDCKKNTCTCRTNYGREAIYFSKIPKQVYAYHGSRSYTDVGVGSVKALQRRKVKRVYLPETDDRGVGSSDLSAYAIRNIRLFKGSYYDHKKTSSKCVGGIIEYNTGCVLSEKLSPIVNTKSGTTSPKLPEGQKNIEIGSNTVVKKVETIGTQFEVYDKEEKVPPKKEEPKLETTSPNVCEPMQKYKNSSHIRKSDKKIKEAERQFSSDSLVQHVHNLEIPSEEKPSRTSMDPMENKLEREYRRLFATKDNNSKASCEKPMPEFKSASILRRRFEALRRGLTKKDELKKSSFIPKSSQSRESLASHKDASVTSDPPSLEARSYSDAKRYSPIQANIIEQETPRMNYRNERPSVQYATEMDSDCQGVKGMFKLWGKKFNLEEDYYNKKHATPMPSYSIPKKSEKEVEKKQSQKNKPEPEIKKEKRFFFFKKKPKEKTIAEYHEKSKIKADNVTAGRCEIADGITLKMGRPSTPASATKEKTSKASEEGEEITRKRWLRRYLSHTIESARSVNVRWNNTTYATSSSTVFELLDTVYKNTEIFIRSHSEMTSSLESYYRSNTRNKVSFIQDIEAWMIPKTITDRPKEIPVKISSKKDISQKNIELSYFDQKWLIDKSKALSHKIELVLHSKNLNVKRKVSSEYLRIDIPKDFFDDLSSDESKRNQTSDEEVYKIVEYETDTDSKKVKKTRMEKGDNPESDIKVIVSVQDSKNMESKILETVIKRPPTLRDVIIQGSNVNIPKRCDVIGVGIITQRDLREMRKPILKIQAVSSSEDSEPPPSLHQKKCEFAESYLQEYYKHWTPLGLDLYSCVSDSHLKSCSEKSLSFHNQQGDGSKSCPNICDDYQASTIVSSCETSSGCSYNKENKKSQKFFNFKKKEKDKDDAGKRMLPKDSLEVFKKRKIYALSNKSQWSCAEDKPVSVPSFESRGDQDCQDSKVGKVCRNDNCPIIQKPVLMDPTKKKICKKHVSMPDCETMVTGLKKQLIELPGGILSFKGSIGCDFCKKKSTTSAKHATIQPQPSLEIPEPPCKVTCVKQTKPACIKPGSPSCNIPSEDLLNPPPPAPQPTVCPGLPLPKCTPAPVCPGIESSSKPTCPPSPPKCPSPPLKSPPVPPCKTQPIPPPCPPTPPKQPSPCKSKSSQSITPRSSGANSPPCTVIKILNKPVPPTPCPTLNSTKPKLPVSPRPAENKNKPKPPPPCKQPKPPSPCKSTSSQSMSPRSSGANSPSCPVRKKSSKSPPPKPCPPVKSKKPKCPSPCSAEKKKKPKPPSPKPCPSPPKKIDPKCTCSDVSLSSSKNNKPPCPAMKPDCKGFIPSCPSMEPQCPSKLPNPLPPPPCPASLPACQRPSRSFFGLSMLRKNSAPKSSKKKSVCQQCTTTEKLPESSSISSCRGCMSKMKKPKKNKKTECCSPPSNEVSKCPSLNQASQCPSSTECSKCSQYSPPASPSPCPSPNLSPSPISSGISLCSNPHPPKPKPPRPPKPPRLSTCHRPPCSKIDTKTSKEKKKSKEKKCGQIDTKPSKEKKSKEQKCGQIDTKLSKEKKSKEPKCGQIDTKPKSTEPECCPDFPWPMNSQCSNQPSPQPSEGCLDKPKDDTTECKKNCSMMKTNAGQFTNPAPKKERSGPPSQSKAKETKPGCDENNNKRTKSGLHLRKNPSKKKTCAKECSAWESGVLEPGIVKLNSREKITIKLKQQSPSTECIRECMDVKVKDEDGDTLFERKDYTAGNNRSSICGNIYDAKLNRISTPVMVTNLASDNEQDLVNIKSEPSLSNLVEIQFKLRIVHGDKTTELNIGKEEDREENKEVIGNVPEIYSVKNDEREEVIDEGNPKNDISIKIIVKNYKPKSEKHKSDREKEAADEYYNKISQKFNSVSTGYSDIFIEPTDENDNVFSVHRTTMNFASSTEKSKTYSATSEERSKTHIVASKEKSNISATSNEKSKTYSATSQEKSKTYNPASDKISKTHCTASNEKSNISAASNKKSTISVASNEKSKTYSAASQEKSKTRSAASNEKCVIHSVESNATSQTHSAPNKDKSKTHSAASYEKSATHSVVSNDVDESMEPIDNTKSRTSYTVPSLSNEELVLVTEDEAPDNTKTNLQAYDTHYEYLRETYSNYFNKAHTETLQKEQDNYAVAVESKENIESNSKEKSKFAKKELLKRVFQRAHSKPKSKGRVRQLREMLKIILTDSSTNEDVTITSNELAKDVTYTSLKPNYFRDTDSMNNYYKIESAISSLKFQTTLMEPNNYPTKENNSDDSEEDSEPASPKYRGCMCSKVAEKIKDPSLNISCCCRKKTKQDCEMSCDLYEDVNKIEALDVQTQKSTILSKNNSDKSTNIPGKVVSKIREFTASKIGKLLSPSKPDNQMSKHKNNIAVFNSELSNNKLKKDSDITVVINSEIKSTEKQKKNNYPNAADILQCYETKKAVLEIYAEKTYSEHGQHLVAKLPKFLYEKESEIERNYDKIATNSYMSVCTKNVFMMSVGR